MKKWLRELKYKISYGGIFNKIIALCVGIALIVLVFKVILIGSEIGIERELINKIFMIIALIIAFSIHEFAHVLAAYLSGDETAKDDGRLTLNIFKHLDPVGILFPIMMIMMGSGMIFGWAKPVPVDYMRFKNGKIGEFFVAIAGVTTNFLAAILSVLIVRFFPQILWNSTMVDFINIFISLNVSLGIFNLLPIPPLDGSKVVGALLDGELREKWLALGRYGYMFIIIGSYTGVLSFVMRPLHILFMNFLRSLM